MLGRSSFPKCPEQAYSLAHGLEDELPDGEIPEDNCSVFPGRFPTTNSPELVEERYVNTIPHYDIFTALYIDWAEQSQEIFFVVEVPAQVVGENSPSVKET